MADQFAYQSANQDLNNQTQPYGSFDYNNQEYMNFPNQNLASFTQNTNTTWNQAQPTNFNQNTDCYQNFNTSQFNSQQTLPNNASQFNSYPSVQNNYSLNNSGYNMQSANVPIESYGNQNVYQDNSRAGSSNYKGAPGNNRNSGHNFNKGGKNNGYSNVGMEEQHDTIFVSGLPESTTELQLQEYFGSIGLIKIDKKTGKPKIWIYRDKESQKPKGEVTITYDDPPTAKSAITWFDGKEFYGSVIKVELAQRKNNYLNSGKNYGGNRDNGNRNSGRDYDKGGNSDRNNSGSNGREGDWLCPNPSCKNNNFAWRTSCNRCKTEKPNTGSSNYSSGSNSDRRSDMPPFERRNNMGGIGNRGGPPSGRRDGPRNNSGSFNRSGRNGGQQGDRSFSKYGGNNRDQRGGGRKGGPNGGARSGAPIRGSDNKRIVPY